MLDHIGLQVQDVEKSLDFYLRTFAPDRDARDHSLPGRRDHRGRPGRSRRPGGILLSPPTGTETRELHVAFKAPDRAAVDAVQEAAVAAGVEVLHAPREFPEYTRATTACSSATWTATTSKPSTTVSPAGSSKARPAADRGIR